MLLSCRTRRTLAFACSCLAVFGAFAEAASASNDPLAIYLAGPSVSFDVKTDGVIDVYLMAHTGKSELPDGAAPVPAIVFDSEAVTASYRRIDKIVRPWAPLRASTPHAQPRADGTIDVSFGSIPSTPGATYEVRVGGIGNAIGWESGGPTPAPGEYDDLVERASLAFCSKRESAAEIVASARQTIAVLTIPSVAVRQPDEALAEAKRAFVGHTARVLRAGAGVTLDYDSPHACPKTVVLERGESVEVLDILRVDIVNATSVGAAGVPASAGLPPNVGRHSPNAIMVTLAQSDKLEAHPTLTFASTDELRQYLAPR